MVDQETVEAFSNWVRTKNPRGRFIYLSNDHCVFAQFLKETGMAERPLVSGIAWADSSGPSRNKIPLFLHSESDDFGETECPLTASTFGGVAKRIDRRLEFVNG